MIKPITLTLIFSTLFHFLAISQFEESSDTKELSKEKRTHIDWNPEKEFQTADLSVFGAFGYQYYNRYEQNLFVGVALEYGFDKHWSSNYRVQAGPDFFHFPLFTPIAALAWVCSYERRLESDFVKYLFLIPEGVSYSFDPIPGLTMKPYVNPLGVTILGSIDNQNVKEYEVYMMLSMGGQMQLTAFETWAISAYGEYRYSWDGNRSGVQTGITISHNFSLENRYPFWF